MKLVVASVAALAAGAQAAVTAGFCDGLAAGNYQHDTEALDSGYYYTCATEEDSDPIENLCPQADVMDNAGVVSKEQLVYNPNNGNADCSIVSPGGYCDFAANVDFSAGNGVDASIDCTADDGSGSATTTTTVAVTTTALASEPAGYNAAFCASLDSGNQIFADSCAEGFYYQCANGMTYLMQCPTGTVFSPSLGTCDWADDVSDCASAATTTAAVTTTMDSGSGAATTTTTAAATTTTVSEVVSCDYDWSSATFGECQTTNWCNGKASGFYPADTTAECDAGTYYSCNMGVFTELACGAGTRWYVPSPLPSWATQWYGYCNDAADVTC